MPLHVVPPLNSTIRHGKYRYPPRHVPWSAAHREPVTLPKEWITPLTMRLESVSNAIHHVCQCRLLDHSITVHYNGIGLPANTLFLISHTNKAPCTTHSLTHSFVKDSTINAFHCRSLTFRAPPSLNSTLLYCPNSCNHIHWRRTTYHARGSQGH